MHLCNFEEGGSACRIVFSALHVASCLALEAKSAKEANESDSVQWYPKCDNWNACSKADGDTRILDKSVPFRICDFWRQRARVIVKNSKEAKYPFPRISPSGTFKILVYPFKHLSEARSRLYRIRFLRLKVHFVEFFVLCKIVSTKFQILRTFRTVAFVLQLQRNFVKIHARKHIMQNSSNSIACFRISHNFRDCDKRDITNVFF